MHCTYELTCAILKLESSTILVRVKGEIYMCICNAAKKIGLLQAGESMEGTLGFLFGIIFWSSLFRLGLHLTFGI